MALAETRIVDCDLTSDANFRAWGLAIRTALTDAGIIRTSDTGQIDFTTVTSPAISSFGGYDIFRFPNSTDQTNFPVFFKLEYGKGATLPRQALRLTVGTGSNGSGTINGIVDSAQTLTAGVYTPSGGAYLGASYFDGGLMLHCPLGAGGVEDSRSSFLIERIKRRSDGATTAGIQVLGWIAATANPQVNRVFNAAWSTGSMTALLATSATNGQMCLGGYMSLDLAAALLRSVAFVKTGLLSVGDTTVTAAEDTTSLTYKKIATASTASLTNFVGTAITHDILLRSA